MEKKLIALLYQKQINQVINVKEKKNNKQKWWDKFLSHLGKTDMESTKNGTTKHIFIALAALIGFVTFCIAAFYLGTIVSVSNAAATIGKDNPEIIAGLIDEDFGWASLAKQVPMEIDIEGDFKGHFTNTTKRTLVNADPKCIDEYYLVAGSPNWTVVDRERMLDPECHFFSYEDGIDYYRCPERNCEQMVVNSTVAEEFLPTSVQVTKISIRTG